MKRRRPKQKTVKTASTASAVRTRSDALVMSVASNLQHSFPVLEDELILIETYLRDILDEVLKDAPDHDDSPH